MKANPKIRNFLFLAFSAVQISWASGSWVGNSPMNIAHYKPETFGSSPYSSDQVSSEVEWNSLLLPKGISRLRFEWGTVRPKNYESQSYMDFSYQYAFTERLTTNTLLNWGYSLLSGNGRGHEVALYFGLYGLGYSSYAGLVTAPGVGLGYAYTEGPWRFSSRFLMMNSYYFKDSEWGRAQVQFDNALTYRWNEKWSTGLAVKTNITEADEQMDIFTTRESHVFLRPSLTIGRSLTSFGADKRNLDIEVGVGLDDLRNSNIGVSWTW